jgi:nucleoside diphosphate kinase
MITEKSIFTLVIPDWVKKVRVGTVITTYYTKGDKIPEKYKNFNTKKIGKKTYYVDERGRKVIKNPTKMGNPEYWNLNGQSFYSNNITWKQRSTVVNFYHKYFAKYVKEQFKEQFPVFLSYKLDMELKMYDTYSRHTPDITNMWILSKMLEDTIVNEGILRDDSPQFRMKTSYGYEFVEKEEDRKLVLTFKYNKY